MRCALDIGEAMLVCGGEVSRVEDTIARVLRGYRAERVDVFTIISCISLTAVFPDGVVETQIRRVDGKAYATDLDRLERLNALSRTLCQEQPPVEEMHRRISEACAPHLDQRRKALRQCLGYIIAGSAFAMFYGGTPLDGVATAAMAMLTWFLERLMMRLSLHRMFHSFLISFFVGGAAMLLALTGVGVHAGKIMMGVIMLLIPGIAITNSMRDMLIGDIISGILRLVESLLIASAVAAGFALAILLSRGLLPESGLDTLARSPALQILMAAMGAMGFSMVFQLRYRRILLCVIGGGLTWTVYLICSTFLPSTFLCNTVAAAFGACYAECMARARKAPATSFLISSEIALIPGGMLYITMNELVGGRAESALLYGTRTANTAIAIALGIVLVAAFARGLFPLGAERGIFAAGVRKNKVFGASMKTMGRNKYE